MRQNYFLKFLTIFLITCCMWQLNAQTTFNYTGTIQTYTVPAGVTYINIKASGAKGGATRTSTNGGLGASMSGYFAVTAGQEIQLLVGAKGGNHSSGGGGGGGGSFAVLGNDINTGTLLIAASGGGGAGGGYMSFWYGTNQINGGSGNSGLVTIAGGSGNGGDCQSCSGAGGTSGNGGTGGRGYQGAAGGGGGGYLTDGTSSSLYTPIGLGGMALLNGGLGGNGNGGRGGYGGGAGGGPTYSAGGGGAGGYSGGAGGGQGGNIGSGGGGGGSFNSGTNQVNTAGANAGNGQVVITPAPCMAPDTPSLTLSQNNICPGSSTIINISGNLNDATEWVIYSASCGGTEVGRTSTSTFEVTPPNGNTTYYVRGEDGAGCVDESTVICTSITVTAEDSTPPTITCPANITVDNEARACQAFVTIPAPVVSDNCTFLGTGTGTEIDPFTTLERSNTAGNGTYFFNVNGNTFSTVIENGWILVASSAKETSLPELPTTSSMILQSNKILAPSVYADGAISSIRINATGVSTTGVVPTLDITTSNAAVLANLMVNRTLTKGVMGGANEWSGPDAIRASGSCAGGTGRLATSIFHACGNGSGIHWLPSSNLYSESFQSYRNDLNLWIKAETVGNNPSTAYVNDYNDTADASDIYPVGITTITWTVTDASGNTAQCEQTVTVADNEAPTAIAQDIRVELDVNGLVTITPAQINNGSTDNCTISSLLFEGELTAFAEVNENVNLTITLPAGKIVSSVAFASYGTPTGSNGNYTQGSCHAANSQSIVESYALNENSFTIPATNGKFGDPCFGTGKRLFVAVNYLAELPDKTFNCNEVGDNTVKLVVTDVNGNVTTAEANVIVVDNTNPTAIAQEVTIYLDENGEAVTTAEAVNNASSDNCEIESLSLSKTDFDCSNVGDNPVILTVTDVNGNTSTAEANVLVLDNEAPMITCVTNTTRDTDSGGCEYTVVGTEFDATFTDNCSNTTISNDFNGKSSLAGESLLKGENIIIWAVNSNGQTATCTTVITVEDNEAPTITCPDDIEVVTDLGICGAVVDFEVTITDNCSTQSTEQFIVNGDFEMGTLEGWTDISGGAGAFILNDGSISPDGPSSSTAPITGSFDLLTNQNGPSTHMISQPIIIPSNVILSEVSWNDRIRSYADFNDPIQEFRVELLDATMNSIHEIYSTNPGDPTIQNGPNSRLFDLTTILKSLEGQTVYLSFYQKTESFFFNVNIDDVSFIVKTMGSDTTITQTAGLESGSEFPTGTTTNTFVVTDSSGNTAICSFDVTINDTEAPVITAEAAQDVNLDAACSIEVPNLVDGSSATDNCTATITQLPLAGTVVSSEHNGTVEVIVTATDAAGNIDETTVVLTAKDVSAPVLTAESDQDVNLDDACSITVPNLVDGSTATDNCTYMITQLPSAGTVVPSAHNGTVNVVVTATDAAGSKDETTVVLTAKDVSAPVLTAEANQDVNLEGDCSILVPNLVDGSTATDNCTNTITQLPLAGTEVPSAHNGTVDVVVTATDAAGSKDEMTVVLTAKDVTKPVLTAESDQDVNLDGFCSITVPDVLGTATDNCTVSIVQVPAAGYVVSSEHDGTVDVVVTATDAAGNTDEMTVVLTAKDVSAPVLTAEADQDVDLDDACSITVPNLVDGSTATDNCTYTITQLPLAGTVVPSVHNGTVDVVVTATDAAGNTDEMTVVLTAKDVSAPVLTAEANQDVDLDDACSITVPNLVDGSAATDNCTYTITQLPIAGTVVPSVHNGTVDVVVTATDAAGNTDESTVVLTAKDNEAPVLTAEADQDVELNDACSITVPNLVDGSSATDNCTYTISQVPVEGTVVPSEHNGTVYIVVTATDAAGNIDKTTVVLTAKDVTKPELTAVEDKIENVTDSCEFVIPDYTSETRVTDNCGASTISQTPVVGTVVSGHGTVQVITLTANDGNGNSASTEFTMSLVDKIVPTPSKAALEDVTAECEVLEADVTVPTATDNCGGVVSVTHDVSFPITTQGLTVITWSFEDANGNIAKQTQDVVIEDVNAPVPDVATLEDIVVECEAINIEAPTATDTCGGSITGTTLDPISYVEEGEFMILWEFNDGNGNIATQEQWVTVKDNTAPQINTQDLTITVGQDEPAVITPEQVNDASSDNCSEIVFTLDKDTFDKPGVYEVMLSGTDASGNTSQAPATIKVKRAGADPMEVHVVPTMLTRTSIAKVILPFRGRIMEVQVLEVETNNYKVFDGNKKNVMEIDVAPMKGTLLVKILDNEGNFHLTKLIAL